MSALLRRFDPRLPGVLELHHQTLASETVTPPQSPQQGRRVSDGQLVDQLRSYIRQTECHVVRLEHLLLRRCTGQKD